MDRIHSCFIIISLIGFFFVIFPYYVLVFWGVTVFKQRVSMRDFQFLNRMQYNPYTFAQASWKQ